MLVYFIGAVIFFVSSFLEINKVKWTANYHLGKQAVATLGCFFLIIMLGLRWETATDWNAYYTFFNQQEGVDFFEPNDEFEIGYVYFTRLIHILSSNYSIFLIVHAVLFLSLLYYSYQNLVTEYFILAITMYFAIYIGMTGSNRQLLAIAIGLLAIVQLIKKRHLLFFLLVALAFTFHTTAILLLFFLFFTKKIPWWLWTIAILLSVVFGLSELPNKIFGMAGMLGEAASGKVEFYQGGDQIEGSIFGILKRLMLAFIFIFFADRLRQKNEHFDICLNGFLFSVVLFFLFKQLPIMGRANLYFNVMEPVVMVTIFSILKERVFKNLVLFMYFIIAIFYFKQSIQMYPDLFLPYKGIFINQDLIRQDL